MRRIALALAALGVALLAAQTANASRTSVGGAACGDTIVSDTVLRADVRGCAGPALVIGADGVTLDLGGHAVKGRIVAKDRADLEIRDGSVEGDVRLEGVRHTTVRRVRLRNGSITCLRSAGCSILRNVVISGGIAIVRSDSGVPNRVRDNVVRGARGAGIAADRTDTTSITGNVVRDSATGIEMSHAADLRIARNFLLHNSGDGLSGSFGSVATIVRNVSASNGGEGISLRVWGGETSMTQNIASGNGGTGILGAAIAHWSVVRNLAARNGKAGIAITGAVEDTTLSHNDARRNRLLGIDAAPAVTDGGGNTARANGTPAQCAGIACR
jgi:Periplasmic copper-binding protein (NosD)